MPNVLLTFLLSLMLGGQPVFTAEPVPDTVYARIVGHSLPHDATVSRDDLCYLRLSYIDFEGREREGEMICNRAIADDLLYIFRRLHEARYPIASLRLIDDFDADDERSMCANNTSCFCYRVVAGSKKLSRHALGMAVDLNPLQNPCVRRRADGETTVQPSTATSYTDRKRSFKHKIDRHDLAYRLFTERGFKWGGAWRSVKDYQHFEKY